VAGSPSAPSGIDPLWPADLDHIALISPDSAASAAWYETHLGLTDREPLEDGGIALSGPERRLILMPGTSKGLAWLAYRTKDPARLAASLTAAGIGWSEGRSPFFAGPQMLLRDPDGNQILFGAPGPGAAGSPSAPRGRLQHAGIATPQIAAMLEFYLALGFRISDRVMTGEGELTAVFLRSSTEHHSLALFRAPAAKLDHFCHETSGWNDIRDLADHAAARGTRIEWGAGRHGAGNNLFIFILDPDRNAIEFSAELQQDWPIDRPAGVWRHEERTLNLWGSAWMRS